MFFVTFTTNGQNRVGLMNADRNGVLELERARQAFGIDAPPLPNQMIDLIAAEHEALSTIREIQDRLSAGEGDELVLSLDAVQIVAPIPRPAKNVFAVGLNYAEHNVEWDPNADLPSYPIFFSKVATSVIGPEQPISLHADYTQSLDYEAELAVVIGRGGVNIPRQNAFDHIFGYTIVNDVSARDRQRRTSQWFLGKGMDTFCPMGPFLVHKSALPHPDQLEIQSRVNGEIRQHSNTRHLIFDIPTLIETLSQGLTLEPGDIIATGTCSGVGLGFDPPRFLKSGDVVEIEIEGIGVLRNPVR